MCVLGFHGVYDCYGLVRQASGFIIVSAYGSCLYSQVLDLREEESCAKKIRGAAALQRGI